MDLNYEYESSFKNFIFLTLPKKKKKKRFDFS